MYKLHSDRRPSTPTFVLSVILLSGSQTVLGSQKVFNNYL